ncbi:MAG: hypothetical protein K8W52_19020 [Deltaproteobacteria bacterium]|nr:hypothetical protein [Deltaproteobacteria bacterium]
MSALIEHARKAVTQARAALAATTSLAGMPPIVRRVDGAKAVAFLAALSPAGRCDLVVPLRAGKNLLGLEVGDHNWPAGERPVVEAQQWAIRCEGRTASIADSWSAHYSVLIPVVTSKTWTTGMPRLADLLGARGVVSLTHPSTNGQQLAYRELVEHDIVVDSYRAFTFGWR